MDQRFPPHEPPRPFSCLVYLSQATQAFSREALARLADLAALRNAQLDIAGFLYFEKDCFVQYLEGSAESLQPLILRIRADPRHKILGETWKEIGEMRFRRWRMRWLDPAELQTLNLDHLLLDQLRLLVEVPPETSAGLSSTVWSAVDQIAKMQLRLPSTRPARALEKGWAPRNLS